VEPVQNKPVTRREILNLIGLTGGSAAVLNASTALGLIPLTSVAAIPQLTPLGPAQKKTVAILGAGISGLTAMYELTKAGYDCILLEASHRPGGRNMTVRSGDIIDEIGNRQVVEFDNEPHMYFNCGPARLPSTHRNILHYCKELGVDLEIFINENKETYYQDDEMFGGKPIKNAVFTTNARGFMAEIMAKNFTRQELDQPFSEYEAERLLGMIRSFGALNSSMKFTGSDRAGLVSGGFLHHGVQKEMVEFRELLKSRYITSALNANEGETGPILFQPVGGMDKIIEGFVKKLSDRIYYNAIVTSVEIGTRGTSISYEYKGLHNSLQVDYCLNCIPSHLMAGIPHNFPVAYTKALNYIRRGEAYKSAFQTKTRFWEKDDIYGGISWVNAPIGQIWYPVHGMHKQKGVILSAYDFGGGMHFTQLSQAERIEAAIKQGEKVHPEYREQVEKGITIAWHRMNHMLGCAAKWARNAGGMTHEEEEMLETLRQPAGGRHYMIGDQVTLHSGWQESAILSAHWAIEDINNRVKSSMEISRV
jgi:monoamine oxidase